MLELLTKRNGSIHVDIVDRMLTMESKLRVEMKKALLFIGWIHQPLTEHPSCSNHREK